VSKTTANCGTECGVQVTEIDNFVEENNLETGLIKVDIEGFEQMLLRATEKTIRKQKPILMICFDHSGSDLST
jgi:FkbM family methyltransferase